MIGNDGGLGGRGWFCFLFDNKKWNNEEKKITAMTAGKILRS